MARSNRPRRRRGNHHEPEEIDLTRVLFGMRRTEVRRGRSWNVQPVSGNNSEKSYVCPGCGGTIQSGTPHLVAWRADGLMGEAADLEGRRHWHSRCWQAS